MLVFLKIVLTHPCTHVVLILNAPFSFFCSFLNFRDSVKFSKIIHKALPVVAMLLGSKQSTDILEAIDFFVSAFEFGVQNSMLGVRRMLSLIWSGEATIREAVVAAYKRLYIEVFLHIQERK